MRLYKRNGSPHWWATWNDQNGRRRRKSTGTEDKDLAQTLAAKWQQESFMERHFGVIPEVPFRAALLRYGAEKKRQNLESYEGSARFRLQLLLDRFDGLNLSGLTAAKLQEFTEERLETVKEATALKELATLKAILNKAYREQKLAAVPPFPQLKAPRGRCRWLTPAEEFRLTAVAAAHLKRLIAFAVDTGGRRSELLKLDWRNVDLAAGRVTFTKTKNGEDRTIRMTDRAQKVLKDIGPKDTGTVFTYHGKPIRSIKSSFESARKNAGLEDVRFHDLRHTFASRLVQRGVPLYEVMHLTGHKSYSMVQRYAHLAPDYQERAIEALNTFGHDLGTADASPDRPETSKPLKGMVGAAGIEPATPAV